MPLLAVCQCLPIYVEHLCLLDVTSIFRTSNKKRATKPSPSTQLISQMNSTMAPPLPSSRSSSRARLRKKKRRFVLFHQIFLLVAISNESSNEATPRSRAESKDCERGVVNDRRFSFLFFFSNRDLLFAVKFYDTRG